MPSPTTEDIEALPSPPIGAAPPAIFYHHTPDMDVPQSHPTPGSVVTFVSEYVVSNTPQTHSPVDNALPPLLEDPPQNSSSTTTAIPSQVAPEISPSANPTHHKMTSMEIFGLLVKSTVAWVLGGVCVMIAGIGIAEGVILPRIYGCPPSAECPSSFDIDKTNAVTLLQTLMQYWLQGGMLVASMGLLKLSAYQAWFVMMRDGNTMDNLDLNLGAIRGSFLDALRLLFRKRNTWIGAYVLGQLIAVTAISLIIGLSISKEKGTRLVTFTYSGNTRYPNSNIQHLNTPGQLLAIAKVNAWALNNDTSHSSAYRGSLVVPDSRNLSVKAVAGGPRITGTISCAGVTNYTITMNTDNKPQYNMWYAPTGLQYIATGDMQLAVSMVNVGTAVTKYYWASNSTGRLQNATRSSDGAMDMALCTHWIRFVNDTHATGGQQEIRPNEPLTPGCTDADPSVCVSDSVSNAIVSWWGGKGTTSWNVRCRGGVIGPLPASGVPDEDDCTLTSERWAETATSMLDGIVQTGERSLEASQKLIVPVETINVRRWWLQALVPLLALLLYAVGLYYTVEVSQGRNVLKKLTLAEVIGAAQTEHVRGLLHSGNLEKAMMQYKSETGFVIPSRLGSDTREGV